MLLDVLLTHTSCISVACSYKQGQVRGENGGCETCGAGQGPNQDTTLCGMYTFYICILFILYIFIKQQDLK